MLLISPIPSELLFLLPILPEFLQFPLYFLKLFPRECFSQSSSEISVFTKSLIKDLEKVRFNPMQLFTSLFGNPKILFATDVQIHHFLLEYTDILKCSFTAHHSFTFGNLETSLDIFIVLDSSISNHWNSKSFFDFSDHFPITFSYFLFVLLFSSAMHC